MESKEDYIFYLKWEDRKVGYFARIEENFYLLISKMDNAKSAYESGFIGLPGFVPGQIYKTPELFEFFKNRIEDEKSGDVYSELIKYNGTSHIDSFSLEEVSELLEEKQKEALKVAYKHQEKLKRIKMQKKEDEKVVY